MFSHSKTAITGGTFTQINTTNWSTKDGFEFLQQSVAHSAFHNSGERFDPPKCHENTRIVVLQRIMDWILRSDPDTRDAVIMWLYGPAGAGKSAIVQTISEMLEAANHPVSSFFFLRHDPMRGNAKALIPTLVYQMMLVFPLTFREVVVQSIERDPLIFTKSLETQFMKLVLDPLEQLFLSGFSSDFTHVVVIDGLDECNDRRIQANIIDVVCKIQHKNRFTPLLFLIASRPEVDINEAFEGNTSVSLCRLVLDDTYLPNEDIRMFLQDKFAATKESHRLRSYIPEWWPTKEAVETLVRKSSGQFIYASTVAKFVTNSRAKPHDRLDIVLGLRPAGRDTPFAELDALYTHILSSVDNLQAVLDVLGLIILRPLATSLAETPRQIPYYSPDHSTEHLESMMGLEPGDLCIVLQDLNSLVVIDGDAVKILHASLEDFLFDRTRSSELFVSRGEMHTRCASLAFETFKTFFLLPVGFASLIRIFYHVRLSSSMPSLTGHILEFTFQKLLSMSQSVMPRVLGGFNPYLAGAYLNYLKELTWDDVKLFRQDQLNAFDRYLESHLEAYFMHDDLLLLLVAVSDFGYVLQCTSQCTRTVDFYRLQLQYTCNKRYGIIFYGDPSNTHEQKFPLVAPLDEYRDELVRYIHDPTRSGQFYLSSRIYSQAALAALKRVSNDCVWSSILPQSLSTQDMHTRRNFPAKWRRKWSQKNANTRGIGTMRAYNFQSVGRVTGWRNTGENKDNRRMISVFQSAVLLLPYLLPKSQSSEELTQLAQTVKFGRRAASFPLEVKAAKRAIKRYLEKVDLEEN